MLLNAISRLVPVRDGDTLQPLNDKTVRPIHMAPLHVGTGENQMHIWGMTGRTRRTLVEHGLLAWLAGMRVERRTNRRCLWAR